MHRLRTFLACLLLCCAAGAALAAPPAAALQDLPAARLAGQGEFTWFGLSIYQAELWVGRDGYLGSAPAAAPFLLELRYARALNGKKIAQASYEQMQKIGAGSETERLAWLQTMNGIFPDVKEGTQLSGLYLPGRGVRFYLDGNALAEVADPALAAAFFGIWLDPASTAPKLRLALLQNAAPRR